MATHNETDYLSENKLYVPEIKICGITTEYEVDILNELEVAYAGFVFCETSKRNVSLEIVEKLVCKMSSKITKVAVFLYPDYEIINNLKKIGVHGVQIHKSFQKERVDKTLFVWDVCSINTDIDKALFDSCKQKFSDPRISGVVFDAQNAGGGKQFSWDIADDIAKIRTIDRNKKMILAGGLNPENVIEGIKQFHPDIVDVSSGVEGIDGKKSKDKITEFVRKVKDYE